MKRVIVALAGGLLCGQALAADLPMPAPPPRAPAAYVPIAPPFSWSGIYVGGNLGAAWNHGTVSDANGLGFTLPSKTPVFTGGGQIGANYQFGAAVVGVEGQFDWLINQNNTSAGVLVPNGTPGGFDTVNVGSQNRWLTTATGKVGFAADHWLFYGKGGWAWVGNSNFTVNDVTTGQTFSSGCESACNKDPLFGVIGIQSGPQHRGPTVASMILGSRGWDAGRGDDWEDSSRVF